MQTYTKMRSRKFPDVIMKVIPGHFVTPNSHINYYIDMTTMRTRQSEAKAAARAMASTYAATTIVDTIVCMDGMEVIGAYLADELTQAGVMSMNAHKTIYVYSPEFDNRGQMIFRENSEMMIKGKHVLLLLASATTGQIIVPTQRLNASSARTTFRSMRSATASDIPSCISLQYTARPSDFIQITSGCHLQQGLTACCFGILHHRLTLQLF